MTDHVQEVLDAYIDCALWSEAIGEDFARTEYERNFDDEPPAPDVSLESYGFTADDIAPDSLAAMQADVIAFLDAAEPDALAFWEQHHGAAAIGHDLWLTRNGHGAGFWDRWNAETIGYGYGMALSYTAQTFGETGLYIGDNGKVYAE